MAGEVGKRIHTFQKDISQERSCYGVVSNMMDG